MKQIIKHSDLEMFLKDLRIISNKHKNEKSKHDFNIFRIIRAGHEEVSLHSQFLFELLSPLGTHNKKNAFLELFINQLNIKFNLDNIEVHCEKDNIDLLIQNSSQAIIIENKIYAGDQPKQLSRYYKIVSNSRIKDIYIVYLSLDGKPPSFQSIENLPLEIIENKLYSKSYKKFINPWLSLCLKECATQPVIRETIVQYQQLLNHLTMSNEVKERKELLNLLGHADYMKQAQFLADNWIHMKWHTEMDFWNELFTQIPNELKPYPIVEEFLFNDKFLNGVIHSSRNKDFEYGLMLKLFNFKDEEICFMIERGEDRLDYGLLINYLNLDKKKWEIKKTDFSDFLKKNISNDFFGDKDSPWIHWKFPKQNIDFETFNNETTLALANPEKRKQIVSNLWKEVTGYINTILKWEGIRELKEN
ncbi:hypothetical protein FG167_16565 [Lacinutrix sp. WUR7]|uniref:PDDEXK-like family protein n=1 Tax=Lacinutrix sp. WUR7 TaxID=2653681 RepID=UPI00193E3E6A|nr:PD-(D/E)XK nuclease family protein [Lacinutrix sp. WUR7]QRM90784.1 hypothetical protein FG167_16565 [Lacinutrix sp. WUR7]